MKNKKLQSVQLNAEQGQFLITIVKKMILTMDLYQVTHKDYILLNQVYDALTQKSNITIPTKSLRGNDSCKSGNCE